MSAFTPFFYTLRENGTAIFRGRNLYWQGAAIVLTFIIVNTGWDWAYYTSTRGSSIFAFAIPAAPLGFLVPFFMPLLILLFASRHNSDAWRRVGYALVQSEVLAWILSVVYKALTGRLHPAVSAHVASTAGDISHMFRFGFLEGGVFWGWPSSHTTVAFAFASTMIMLAPRAYVKLLALVYAVYIAVGVSLTIHWLSDVAAGVIFGSIVGIVVGTSFRTLMFDTPNALEYQEER